MLVWRKRVNDWQIFFAKRNIYKYFEVIDHGSETFSNPEKPNILKEAQKCLDLAQKRMAEINRYCLQEGYITPDQIPLELRGAYKEMSEIIEKIDQIVVREKQKSTNISDESTEQTLKILTSILDGYAVFRPSKNFLRASKESFTSARYGYESKNGKSIYEVVDTGPGFIENARGELEKRMVLEEEGVVIHINIPPTINFSKPVEFQPYLNADGNNLDRTLGILPIRKNNGMTRKLGLKTP